MPPSPYAFAESAVLFKRWVDLKITGDAEKNITGTLMVLQAAGTLNVVNSMMTTQALYSPNGARTRQSLLEVAIVASKTDFTNQNIALLKQAGNVIRSLGIISNKVELALHARPLDQPSSGNYSGLTRVEERKEAFNVAREALFNYSNVVIAFVNLKLVSASLQFLSNDLQGREVFYNAAKKVWDSNVTNNPNKENRPLGRLIAYTAIVDMTGRFGVASRPQASPPTPPAP